MTVPFSQAVMYGALSGLPTPDATKVGRLYGTSDTGTLYRDNGTTWDVIASRSWYNVVLDYNASGSIATTTAAVSSGSPTVTLAAASDFKNGQGIYVANANFGGVSGKFTTTIVSGAGTTTLTVADNAGATVASQVCQHDDTVAIQNMINALQSTGGGVGFFPNGFYRCNAPLTTRTSGIFSSSGVLMYPALDFLVNPAISIHLLGQSAPDQSISLVGTGPVESNGAILQSDGTGGAILAGIAASGASYQFTPILAQITNICFRTYDNPNRIALDLSYIAACDLDLVNADTGINNAGSMTQPTHTGGQGIVFPLISNGAYSRARAAWASGYYYGFNISDELVADYLTANGCLYAATVNNMNDASWITKMVISSCTNGLHFPGGSTSNAYLSISQLRQEYATSGWQSLGNSINDPSNFGIGDINWQSVQEGLGPTNTFTINGGSNLRVRQMGSAPATSAQSVPTFTAATVSNMIGWYEVDFLGLTNGTGIASWTDFSGANNTLTQATGANQPVVATNTLNGYPTATFNGTTPQFVQGGALTGGVASQPITCYFVCKCTQTLTNLLLDGIGSSNRCVIEPGFPTNGNIGLLAGGTDAATSNYSTTAFQIWKVVFNGASSFARINKAAASGNVNPGSNALGGFTLGARFSGSNAFFGSVAVAMIFNKLTTPVDDQAIYNYLSAKYNI